MSKTVIYEEEVAKFNADDGVILHQRKHRAYKSPTEPTDEFIKGSKYLSVIFAYNSIPLKLIPITYLLAERMEFKTNRIHLYKHDKEELAEILGVSLHMIETHIRNLLKYNILQRIDRGYYEVNSFLFSTGSTIETRELQAHFDFDNDAYYSSAEQANVITGKVVKKAVLDYNEKKLRDARSKKGIEGQIALNLESGNHDD